jgi:hypothetical protein
MGKGIYLSHGVVGHGSAYANITRRLDEYRHSLRTSLGGHGLSGETKSNNRGHSKGMLIDDAKRSLSRTSMRIHRTNYLCLSLSLSLSHTPGGRY